jgi:competence protein ComEA
LKLRKSELILLVLTAAFLTAAAVQTLLPLRRPESTLVSTQLSPPPEEMLISGSGETAGEGVGIVNINTADAETLCHLPGIGPELAGRIIARREEHGPFSSPDELMEVSGIGEKTFKALSGLITCKEEAHENTGSR